MAASTPSQPKATKAVAAPRPREDEASAVPPPEAGKSPEGEEEDMSVSQEGRSGGVMLETRFSFLAPPRPPPPGQPGLRPQGSRRPSLSGGGVRSGWVAGRRQRLASPSRVRGSFPVKAW